MSTHTWGEDPKGTWTLEIENHGKILGSLYVSGKVPTYPFPSLSQHFALNEKKVLMVA